MRKLQLIVLVAFVLLTFSMVACTSQEAAVLDNVVQDQATEAASDAAITDTAQEELLSDNDFVEIGEMI